MGIIVYSMLYGKIPLQQHKCKCNRYLYFVTHIKQFHKIYPNMHSAYQFTSFYFDFLHIFFFFFSLLKRFVFAIAFSSYLNKKYIYFSVSLIYICYIFARAKLYTYITNISIKHIERYSPTRPLTLKVYL